VGDLRTVCQLLVAAAIVGVVALGAVLVAPPAHSSVDAPRRVVFLAIAGHGTVTSVPQGIVCPKKCRVLFNKDALVRLVAHPAAGWVLASWSGSCVGHLSSCAFNLTSSHDCAGPMCTIGAFGERVTFARPAN